MIVFCEECGRKYRVDADRIKGNSAQFICKTCGHLVEVQKPALKSPSLSRLSESGVDPAAQDMPPWHVHTKTEIKSETTASSRIAGVNGPQGMGLRSKMLIILIVFPVVALLGASFYVLSQWDQIYSPLVSWKSRMSVDEKKESDFINLESELFESIEKTKRGVAAVWIGSIMVVAAMTCVYVFRLTRKISQLSNDMQRISMGNLDVDIDIVSRDEIGQIIESVARLQDSTRMALDRLKPSRTKSRL